MSAGELRDALARDELVAYFQPQVDLVSEAVLGVEALVRWAHPQHGLLAPAAFLDAATVHGLLGPLTERMLRTSLEALKRFERCGHDLTVSVNVGPETLASPEFVTTVADLLAELEVAGPRLRLEVTETAVMESGDAAIEALGRLRSLGLGASLDDFGTGFSSLARLHSMPIDEVKIDRSFVADMRSRGDMTVVRMIIDLARHLELRVVAEGAEEREDLAVLAGLGCDAAQGYWIARPAPADDLETWLADRERPPVATRVGSTAAQPDAAPVDSATRRSGAISRALKERLDATLRSVAAEHGYDVAACWVRAEDEDALHWAAGWSARDAGAEAFVTRSRSMIFAPGVGLPGRTWRTARPLVIPDLAADGGLRRLRIAMAAGLRSALVLPLRGDDEVVGVIELFARSEHASVPGTADALADRCAHVGEMIARDRARGRAAHLADTLTGVADGLAALRRGAGTDAVPAGVAGAAPAIAEADAVVVWEPELGGRRLRPSHTIGWPGEVPSLSVVERSGAAATFASGTSTFIPDAARHALPHAGLVVQLPVASAFYQPIHRGTLVAGVIALAWKRPRHALCPATRTALQAVADAGSMALAPAEAEPSPRFTR